jgi:hypothetical protein
LRSGLGVLCFAASHQLKSVSSAVGGMQVMRSQDNMSCQTCRVKEQPALRCWTVSGI